MKKQNGFIATALIYSFFLIFITLFLSIIADYLQQKVLLNNIEDGIKLELNSELTLNDFKLGDYISFIDETDTELFNSNQFVVAKINNNNNNQGKFIIIYSLNGIDDISDFNEYKNAFGDNTGSLNNSFFNLDYNGLTNDLLDTIDETSKNKIIDSDNCTLTTTDRTYTCIKSSTNYQRKRIIWNFEITNSYLKASGHGTYQNAYVIQLNKDII